MSEVLAKIKEFKILESLVGSDGRYSASKVCCSAIQGVYICPPSLYSVRITGPLTSLTQYGQCGH